MQLEIVKEEGDGVLGAGVVTVFIHVYRLQRIQFSCAARHNTLAKKTSVE